MKVLYSWGLWYGNANKPVPKLKPQSEFCCDDLEESWEDIEIGPAFHKGYDSSVKPYLFISVEDLDVGGYQGYSELKSRIVRHCDQCGEKFELIEDSPDVGRESV